MNTELGVNYFGFFSEISGIAQATKCNAEALKKNDIKVNHQSFVYTHKIERDLNSNYPSSSDSYPINIFHINIDKINTFLSEFTTDLLKDKYNIAYWAWEFPEIPNEALEVLNFFDELWVPSNFCAEIFAAKSKVPVIKFSHPIEAHALNFSFNKNEYNIQAKSFVFLTLFDSDSTFERKNPIDTIHAFQESFEPDDLKATLIIKTHNFEKNESVKELILKTIGSYKNIIVINEKMSEDKLHSLIQQADVVISLHASEGFGLTLAEAMSYGKVVIATGYSGNIDFMNVNNSMPLKFELSKISKKHGIIEKGFTIAKPNKEHAKELIKYSYTNQEIINTLGQRAQKDIVSEFSKEKIGKLMANRLRLIHSNFLTGSKDKEEQMVMYDYEVKIEKLNKQIKYLEKSLYNKIRKGVNKFLKQLKNKSK